MRDAGLIDLGRLLTDVLGVLDGPLGDADPVERVAGVLRRIADVVDASGWAVAYAPTGAEPRDVAAAARPGRLAGLARRAPWVTAPDLAALRLGAGAGGSGVVISREDERAPAALRERLAQQGLDALLVVCVESPGGTWIAELAGDGRTSALADVEPLLRVLAPEALHDPRGARLVAAR